MSRPRELGRGERVLPGLWRLRLPLPLPGVPHCNAWAIAAGSGFVLVDTGMCVPGSLAQLERAADQVGLRLPDVSQLVITHAHPDHWGQAAPIRARAGCEMWMHPDHASAMRRAADPEGALERQLEVARHSGVPAAVRAQYAREAKALPDGVAEAIEPDRALVDGVTIDTDLGQWRAYETPGHAPSHVCLYQPEHRLLISGDHVLGRISLYWDYGVSPDPIAEFLSSLDRVAQLRARLALSGHGKPFLDVPGHIAGTRALVHERLQAAERAVAAGPRPASAIAPEIHGDDAGEHDPARLLSQALCYLTHLERAGGARRERDGELELWSAAG